MRKHIIPIALIITIIGILSCSKEQEIKVTGGVLTLHNIEAIISEMPQTKAHLEERSRIIWDIGDRIGVFSDIENALPFTRKDNNTGFESDILLRGHKFYGYFPYEDSVFDANNPMLLHFKIGHNTAVGGKNPSLVVPMVATATDSRLSFKQTCGVLHFSITGTEKLVSATLKGNNGEHIAGTFIVDLNSSQPSLSGDGESTIQVFKPADPIQLSNTSYDIYYILPPMTFEKGFSLILDYGNGSVIKSTDKTVTLSRAIIRNFTVVNMDRLIESEKKEEELALEREALIAIYNALDGDNWEDNTNWCSDKPLQEWSHVTVNPNNGYVYSLSIDKKASGQLPPEIAQLKKLSGLYMKGCVNLQGPLPSEITQLRHLHQLIINGCYNLSGQLPDSFDQMKELEYVNISANSIEGTIPSSIWHLEQLKHLNLSGNNLRGIIPEDVESLQSLEYLNLSFNLLAGSIPNGLVKMPKLEVCKLESNNFTGKLPDGIEDTSFWERCWGYILASNYIDCSNLIIKAPSFQVVDINGQELCSSNEYANNTYTVMCMYESTQLDDNAVIRMKQLDATCNQFDSVELILWFPGIGEGNNNDSAKAFIEYAGINCKSFVSTTDNTFDVCEGHDLYYNYDETGGFFPANVYQYIFIVNQEGIIEWMGNDFVHHQNEKYFHFLQEKITGESVPSAYYTSQDFSADGNVHVLQRATVGEGINLVFLGDGFSDRLINDGTYQQYVNKAMSAFFEKEPYNSFRDYFSVYAIDVVSEYEVFGDSVFVNDTHLEITSTALSTYFGQGTYIGGNNGLCISYALNAVGWDKMDNTMIVALVNGQGYGGTCHLYKTSNYNTSKDTDYGEGLSISYFQVGDYLNSTLQHEVCGHGFAKLADEYFYSGTRPTPYDIKGYQGDHKSGWYLNLDFTTDRDEVVWSKFLYDSRYSQENIGIYEGALFEFGAYKPTISSIMNNNYGSFNAPSRYAIWRRINKLAFGDEWNGTYDDFVAFDLGAQQTDASYNPQRTNNVEKHLPQLPPPVVMDHSWSEDLQYSLQTRFNRE